MISASVQPATKKLVGDQVKDLPNSGDSIRQRFLEFYAARGHKILPSASLVPDDPTVLLTIAGMLQFKPIFLGKVFSSFFFLGKNQRCRITEAANTKSLHTKGNLFIFSPAGEHYT